MIPFSLEDFLKCDFGNVWPTPPGSIPASPQQIPVMPTSPPKKSSREVPVYKSDLSDDSPSILKRIPFILHVLRVQRFQRLYLGNNNTVVENKYKKFDKFEQFLVSPGTNRRPNIKSDPDYPSQARRTGNTGPRSNREKDSEDLLRPGNSRD